VSVDVPDKLGYSPLMNAAQRGHVRCVMCWRDDWVSTTPLFFFFVPTM
jgi:hypothetical protein